jgi:transcriptional regulator with PAS, ATPase and Fis domain
MHLTMAPGDDDSREERPADPPTRLTEPATDLPRRIDRWGTTLAVQKGDDRDHALVRRFTLQVVAGADEGQRYVSTGERMVVGTHASCDVVLHDATVSRFHCDITLTGKAVVLRDLDSSNGTIVDGVSIQQAYLRGGSTLTLGRTQLRFDTGGEPVKVPLSGKDQFGVMVGGSAAMRRLFAHLERAAASDGAVLLEGEPGSGKEAAAESIHRESERRAGPLIIVECARIAPDLVDGALFGQAGAGGAFEAAHGGTLVLDEVGELPTSCQQALQRALESGEVKPVGGSQAVPVSARVIAATTRNLKSEVNARRFRSDLYFRLAVIECRLPPLRERPEDLPVLVEHILGAIGASERPEADLLRTRDFYAELGRHAWPGNVRDLRQYVERCLALRAQVGPIADAEAAPAVDLAQPLREARHDWTQRFERRYLESLLRQHNGNVAAAARDAGVHRIQLYRLLGKHGLSQ